MSKLETLIRENNTMRVLLIALATLMTGLPLWYLHTLIIDPLAVLVRVLAETTLIAGFVSIIYELLMKRRFEEEMKHAIIQAINADAGVIKKFSDEAVDSIIKNCLKAKLDLNNEKKADVFFNDLISPALSIENHRKKFDYTIKIDKISDDIVSGDVSFDKESYFCIVEELMFKKHLIFKNDNEVVIGVCFTEKQLKYYQGKECIYRTVFNVQESEKKAISEIVKTGVRLPKDIFKIVVTINNNELMESNFQYDDVKGIEITYKYRDRIRADEDMEVRIRVETLFSKKINYFSAYLFDPTFEPNIKLSYNEDIKKPIGVTYFKSGSGKDLTEGFDFICVTTKKDEWVFPGSGVVFIWELYKETC